MHTKITYSIKDIDRDIWNEVLKGPFFSYEWFLYIEEQYKDDYSPYYFLFYHNSRLTFILPMLAPNTMQNIYNMIYWGRLLRFLKWIPWIHKKPLMCYSICPSTSSAGFFNNNKIPDISLNEILLEINKFAVIEGFTDIVFMWVLESSIAEIKLFESNGYKKIFINSTGILYNRFNSFEDYLKSLKPNARSVVRREIKKFTQSGCEIEVLDNPFEKLNKLYTLANEIQEHHNLSDWEFSFDKMKAVFINMNKYLKSIIAKYDDEIIGTVTYLEKDGIRATYGLGFDYDKSRKNRTYFYIFYYNSIMDMIRNNISKIDFDTTSYTAKERRGCEIIPQYLLVKPLKNKLFFNAWLPLLNYQYRKKFNHQHNENK